MPQVNSPITRIALLWPAVLTVALCWWTPASVSARLIASGGTSAQVALLIFTAVVVVGLADWLVNDMLPRAYSLAWCLRHRHTGYVLLAAGYAIQASAAARGDMLGGGWVLVLGYCGSAVWSAWGAVAMAKGKAGLT